MPVEVIVKPILGSYIARIKGSKSSATRSEGQRQAAEALLRKLGLRDGQLLEQHCNDLKQGHKLFHFHANDEVRHD